MGAKLIVFVTIRFLHDLATAVWIGGLIGMAFAVLPGVRKQLGPGPQAKQLLNAVQGRLRVLVFASIVVLLATGVLMSRRGPQFAGLFSGANPYSALLAWKHVLVIAMVVLSLVRGLTFRRPAPQQGKPGPRERVNVLLLLANALLGIVVILLSAAAAALRARPPV